MLRNSPLFLFSQADTLHLSPLGICQAGFLNLIVLRAWCCWRMPLLRILRSLRGGVPMGSEVGFRPGTHRPSRVCPAGPEARSSARRGLRSQAEHVPWAPEPGRARPVGTEVRPSASCGPRSQIECATWAPKSGQARPVGSEVKPSTSCRHRSQAERVLRAPKPGRSSTCPALSASLLDLCGRS